MVKRKRDKVVVEEEEKKGRRGRGKKAGGRKRMDAEGGFGTLSVGKNGPLKANEAAAMAATSARKKSTRGYSLKSIRCLMVVKSMANSAGTFSG